MLFSSIAYLQFSRQMRRSEAQKPKTFRTLLFDKGPPEAQKPKTFRIAASYAQKLSRRSAQNRFSRHA